MVAYRLQLPHTWNLTAVAPTCKLSRSSALSMTGDDSGEPTTPSPWVSKEFIDAGFGEWKEGVVVSQTPSSSSKE